MDNVFDEKRSCPSCLQNQSVMNGKCEKCNFNLDNHFGTKRFKVGHKLIKSEEFLPLDNYHTMTVTKLSNFNENVLAKYYSPSVLSIELIERGIKTIKGFFGKEYDETCLTIYFSKTTCDCVLFVYDKTDICKMGRKDKDSFVVLIAPKNLQHAKSLYDMEDLTRLV